MRSYTNLEQSKKLAEILPVESADLWWGTNEFKPRFHKHYHQYLGITINLIPCWSLAALLDILSNRAYFIDEDANVTLSSYKTVEWDLSIINSGLEDVTKSDPIDTCVKMIYTLKNKDLI